VPEAQRSYTKAHHSYRKKSLTLKPINRCQPHIEEIKDVDALKPPITARMARSLSGYTKMQSSEKGERWRMKMIV
jgi:hypothetical protein